MALFQASITADCVAITPVPYPFPPPGVRIVDLEALRASNYTRGLRGNNLSYVFSNATATAEYAARVEAARGAAAKIADCEARFSPTLSGVFLITFATLAYCAWRRGQMRERFGLPGSPSEDWAWWLFCSCCTACQEYRTMRLHHVEDGVWGGKVGWLLDGTAPTQSAPPATLEMV